MRSTPRLQNTYIFIFFNNLKVSLAGYAQIYCVRYRTYCIRFYGYFIHSEHWIPNPAVRATIIKLYQETILNKDQVKGRIKETKGEAKEIAGKVVGNKELERKGKIKNAEGKV